MALLHYGSLTLVIIFKMAYILNILCEKSLIPDITINLIIQSMFFMFHFLIQ